VSKSVDANADDFITVQIGGQLFGIPILEVHDVFRLERMTRVPLSRPDIAGVLNLRGRIATTIDCRARLGIPPRAEGAAPLAVGVEHGNELYGLLIDSVGEVLSLSADSFEPNPVNLDPRWQKISKGIYRLEGKLLVVLDMTALLDIAKRDAA